MKFIEKNLANQPVSLIKHRQQPHATYRNYYEKDDLREALLHEQGFICCYCMRRIQNAVAQKMVLEHFNPESIYDGSIEGKPNLTLDYENILASCTGGDKGHKKQFHCDESKRNFEITLSPTNPVMMEKIKFDGLGRIFTNDDVLNADIEILNLNNQSLVRERQVILEGLKKQINKESKGKNITKSFLTASLKEWENRVENQYRPLCQVAIYYLRKKMKNAI